MEDGCSRLRLQFWLKTDVQMLGAAFVVVRVAWQCEWQVCYGLLIALGNVNLVMKSNNASSEDSCI